MLSETAICIEAVLRDGWPRATGTRRASESVDVQGTMSFPVERRNAVATLPVGPEGMEGIPSTCDEDGDRVREEEEEEEE